MKDIKRVTSKMLMPVLTVCFFAFHPIVALYAHNADQLMIKQLILPIIFSLALGTILFGFWLLVFKNSFRAGLATVIFLIIFWNYGLIYMVITRFINLKHWHVIPILFFIYVHLVWFISKIRLEKTLNNLNTILLAPISLLLIINLVTILPVEHQKIKSAQNGPAHHQIVPGSGAGKNYPDVYLIILDEYASLRTIKEEWGYDNSAFADFLRGEGFFVAESSKTRYDQTVMCMASVLNLNYISEPNRENLADNSSADPEGSNKSGVKDKALQAHFNFFIQKMNNCFLTNYFKEHGYQVIVLEGVSQHYASFKIQDADTTFSYQNINKSDNYVFLINAFYMALVKKSMLFPIDVRGKMDQTGTVNYAATKYVVNYLKTDGFSTGTPKFVYAHIMCPHSPHVFDQEGNAISPITADDQRDGEFIPAKNTVNAAYLEQYIYITNEIKKIAHSRIQKKSRFSPVIIIQSDHGPRPHEVFLKDREQSSRVFNAVFFPDDDYKNLYDSIAPVNTMRAVLNKYFGEHYNMLEDK